MKKNLIYAGMLLLGIMVATSCSNEEHLEQMMSNGNTVQAVIENVANTRTSVNESYQVVWTTEDKFDVWDDNEFKGVLKLISGAGTTSASYGDADPDNPVNATSGMTAFFPSYDGTPNKKAFVFLETYDSQETDAPMLGSFDGSKFTFNLLTAMVRVVVADVPAGEISFTISSKNNEILTGEAALDEDGKLSVPASGASSVSVNFTTTEAKTLTFDVPIPIQDYTNGLNVIVKSGANKILDKTTNHINASAGILYLFNDAYVSVSDADGASTELAKNEVTAVKVASVEAGDNITIPAKSETSADVMHTIDLSDATLPTSGTVNINVTEATDNAKSTVKKLTVVVPNGTSESSLNINAPGTTVTIKSETGTVINVLEATTAENTLIIGAGVTVKSLTINKGNVKLEDGAKVELFKVKDAAGLKNAIALGGNVELENSIDLDLTSGTTLTIASGKEVSINLNTYTLTTSTTTAGLDEITVVGKLSVSNGAISASNTAFYVNGGELALEKCTITAPSQYATVYSVGGTVTAKNVTATVGNTAFYTNGGTMSLEGCEVTNSNGAVNAVAVYNSGELTISGGSYTNTVNDASHDKSYTILVNASSAEINTTVSGGNGGVTVLGGSEVDFTGGSYTAVKACGLYVNENSTVTYTNDCTFSGVEGNVVVGSNGIVNETEYTEYTKVK